jgi:predicted phosphate transport protein (TIGR00153 family)
MANIFGSSPVQPLEKHIDVACCCAEQLRDLVEAAESESWEAAEAVRDRIEKLEQKADDIKKEIRLNLRRSLFMPVAKDDLLRLLKVQDAIADRTRDVSRIIVSRRMTIPEPIFDQYLEFMDRNVDAARQARKSVQELDELFTVGFRGAEVELVSGFIDELGQMHKETDNMQSGLRAALHQIESTLNPVDTVFLYQMIDETWRVSEAAEDVGHCLELLISH